MKLMSNIGVFPLIGLAIAGMVMVFAGSYAYAGTYAGKTSADSSDKIVLADRGKKRGAKRRGNDPSRSREQNRRTETTRTDNGYKRDTTWTGRDGRTVARAEDVQYDRENGTRTRDVTWTGPEGNTRGRSDTVTRTEDGYDRHTEFTGPNGNTATRDAEGRYDRENRTRTRDVRWTGPNGNTVDRSDTATRTDDGYDRTTEITGPQGNSTIRSVQGRWDPETQTWARDIEIDAEHAN